MGLSREDMLRELELLPVWRLRDPAVLPPAGQPQDERREAAAIEPESVEARADASASEVASEPLQTQAPGPVETAPAPIAAQAEPIPEAGNHEAGDMQPDPEYFEAMQSWPEFGDSVVPPLFEDEVSAPQGDRRTAIMAMDWQALQQSVSECEACDLAQKRTQTVFGVGDPNAEWLFVGEAPGAEEDRRGEPFVGPAGQLLDNMLAAIALKRGENVYIANVLKCRPPANRDPHGEEVVKCDPYLKRQVELIKPKLIVALGKFAAQSLLASDKSIAGLRGKLHDFHGVPVIITYHPAYLLRNMPDKAKAWDDLCFARETMRGLQSAASPPSSA
ncbi:uracil-DNA glycosylase family protein [Methylobacillus pratensis]